MSLITRCPACGTMFKVVTDQLKVSQGWVRCGQCSEVFDAQLHLQAASAVPLAVTLAEAPLSAPVFDVSTAALVPEDSSANSYEQDVVAALKMPAATANDTLPVDQHMTGSLVHIEHPNAEPAGAADTQLTDDASASSLDDVPFVRDARRQAFWRKPFVRSSLVLFALILICLLGVQFAVQQRDALLAFEPRTKPWLQALCEPLACDLTLPRRIEAIVIDSSSFNKAEGNNSYRLSFALKNASTSVVAMPSLEVSLTDSQDQILIRRVLSPAQFGSANGMLSGSADFSNTLTLQVQSGSPALRIAGYRLLAFYP
jgi:predicted Zn finger-like uncharacterized protein